MDPYYADDWLTVYLGDCRAVLAELPAESVHCVITSPPYYGLRDYGTASWEGGDAGCDHKPDADAVFRAGVASSTLGGGKGNQANAQLAPKRSGMGPECSRCGARRIDSQIGLEPTPEQYVAELVAVFREIRRVLRPDGTVWLNLGDSYSAASTHGGSDKAGIHAHGEQSARALRGRDPKRFRDGLKPKDRMMIPARVALALQADGWWLRDEIVWAKPNPMPSSVTDRTTPAHEMVYLLTKRARYYFDADAIREPIGESMQAAIDRPRKGLKVPGGWDIEPGSHAGPHRQGRTSATYKHDLAMEPLGKAIASGNRAFTDPGSLERIAAGRNKRSVWTIATQPYPEAHFATFPEALVEPMILAGTSERGVCPECGAPWVRVVEREPGQSETATRPKKTAGMASATSTLSMGSGSRGWVDRGPRILGEGWQPSCSHGLDPVPATVLDCFAGSGTVGLVAQRLSRRAILIDLSAEYMRQLMKRNQDMPLGLVAS